MSDNKQSSHKIGKIKQLIDLNGEHTNFDLSFTVTCKEGKPFQLLVVDQTTLDNTPDLEYKNITDGTISGHIVADKNVYQNYFMILKADETCSVDVERKLTVLPKTPDINMGDIDRQSPSIVKPYRIVNGNDDGISWLKIGLIALVVVIGCAILWWLYNRKSTSPNDNLKAPYAAVPMKFASPSIHASPEPAPVPRQQLAGPSPISPIVNQSPVGDSRGYKPTNQRFGKHTSPDAMSSAGNSVSNRSHGSYNGGGGGNSLLSRLRKFAR